MVWKNGRRWTFPFYFLRAKELHTEMLFSHVEKEMGCYRWLDNIFRSKSQGKGN